MSIEERNKPTVALINFGFINDALSAKLGKGMPGLRVITEQIPSECNVTSQIEAGIRPLMDDIISALTRPLTEEEKSPPAKKLENSARIVFKGNLEEVQHFFYRRGWTDGMPVIPPTEEAVAEMLTGTDLSPDYLVAALEPRTGKATVEKIAINAVMAGALPVHLPLIIAGVQAMNEPKAHGNGWAVSAGSWAPFWAINGPIRKILDIRSGVGALSPGNMANAAIGRSLSLINQNIRGVRNGIECMGTLGNPMKYSMVIAEDEESSPWEPLHVERGYKKEDNTITVFFPHTFNQISSYTTGAEGIMRGATYGVAHGGAGLTCVIMLPSHAKTLAGEGWSKKDVKTYISEYARIQFNQYAQFYKYTSASPPLRDKRQAFGARILPMNPDDSVRIMPDPEALMIVVAGGSGSLMGILRGARIDEDYLTTDFVTRKAELPAGWDKLVAKYKNMVPNYALY
jgi:hypothetical protein